MFHPPFESFRQLVFQDPSLQVQLHAVTDAVQFSLRAAQLGAERGCQFSADEVNAALLATSHAWHMREFTRQSQPITTAPASLHGWVPIDVYALPHAQQPCVEWCYFGPERFTDSFFSQTVNWQMSQPFARLFRLHTPIEALHQWREQQPGLPVGGFIFHLSRCGSTLMAQMLAALPCNVVLSEAPPFDSVLRTANANDEQRIQWLRDIVSALGQPRAGREQQVWFKLDSWHVLQLPLIERAFPDVPWVFLYRDPVEVLVSHARQRGPQMMPGLIAPQWFGMEPAELAGMDFDEYTARTMARICEAALQHRAVGKGRLVNYRELPAAFYDLIPGFFDRTLTADEETALRKVSGRDAKTPKMPFNNDTADKQQRATNHLRALAERWVNPVYQQLETARLAQPVTQMATQLALPTFNDPLTQRIAAFLQEIGIEVLPAVYDEKTFLPGIAVSEGRLLVDESKLLYPGDLLHEAGHLAVLPSAQRAHAGGQILPEAEGESEVIEVAAIAWSYAAALRVGLDPAVVFHPHGYRSNAAGLLRGFQLGVYPGLAGLAAAGLTLDNQQARAQGVPGYPHMLKWLRD